MIHILGQLSANISGHVIEIAMCILAGYVALKFIRGILKWLVIAAVIILAIRLTGVF